MSTPADFGPCNLPDGIYQVRTPYLCAGFSVAAGRCISKAPIIKNIRYVDFWKRKGQLQKIADLPNKKYTSNENYAKEETNET